jgi:Spy/CpxP family protein refolding chaperone
MRVTDPTLLRVRLLTGATLVAVFAAGTVTGAGLYRWGSHEHHPPPPAGLDRPIPLDELKLSDVQRDQAWQIMDKHRPELDSILEETFPKVRAVNERMRDDLRAVLTPPQREKFDQLVARQSQRTLAPPNGHPMGRREPPLAPPPPFELELAAPTAPGSSSQPR